MRSVRIDSCNIISPLGNEAPSVFVEVMKHHSGVKEHSFGKTGMDQVFASVFGSGITESNNTFSGYERLLVDSMSGALRESGVNASSSGTLFVFSTTKGNIGLLEEPGGEEPGPDELSLFTSAMKVTQHFGNPNVPVVISNACISGVVALIYASRMIRTGKFDSVVVTGADTFTRFVHSGFQSFQALSPGTCRPFSANRDGINLGEAAATMILAGQADDSTSGVYILEGSVTNDANHISGPSRTGEELAEAIKASVEGSGIKAADISFISAHGTATPYNDEMESKAFRIAGLAGVPVNSLKGYFGHTLGAAGLVESVVNLLAMQHGVIPPTFGFTGEALDSDLRVSNHEQQVAPARYMLKTASGFGGCNAALVFKHETNI